MDDRVPILLVVLDGLGDRRSIELGGRTASEAAQTPILDRLVEVGAQGLHVPFGPGRATSSESAHWAMFGFGDIPFPGRVAIEGLGVGLKLPTRVPMFHLALRAGKPGKKGLMLGARARRGVDEQVAGELFSALEGREVHGIEFELMPLRVGECVLLARGGGSRDVSDSDALFDHIHPWMRPQPLAESAVLESAGLVAGALERWLIEGRGILRRHPLNEKRQSDGIAPLDTPVTKWASWIDPDQPSFEEHVGVAGAAVTDTALYRGLARSLDMAMVDLPYDPKNPGLDMANRLDAAGQLLNQADFVHVHIKATDEAGHSKRPERKKQVIEWTDDGLKALLALRERAVVAVTGDHATPSTGSLLHSGDPTPFVVAGPAVSPDVTTSFGERPAMGGDCGVIAASDIMPLLLGLANRPFFKGHRPGARKTLALPNNPDPMPISD